MLNDVKIIFLKRYVMTILLHTKIVFFTYSILKKRMGIQACILPPAKLEGKSFVNSSHVEIMCILYILIFSFQ